MTTIIIKQIVNGKSTNNILIKETVKPLYYEDRELKKINYLETTAYTPFCDITFNDNNKTYTIQAHKLNTQNMEYKKE